MSALSLRPARCANQRPVRFAGVWLGHQLCDAAGPTSHRAQRLDAQLPGGVAQWRADRGAAAQPSRHAWRLLQPRWPQAGSQPGAVVLGSARRSTPLHLAWAAGLPPRRLCRVQPGLQPQAKPPPPRCGRPSEALRCRDVLAMVAWLPPGAARSVAPYLAAAQMGQVAVRVFRPPGCASGIACAAAVARVQRRDQPLAMRVQVLKARGPPLFEASLCVASGLSPLAQVLAAGITRQPAAARAGRCCARNACAVITRFLLHLQHCPHWRWPLRSGCGGGWRFGWFARACRWVEGVAHLLDRLAVPGNPLNPASPAPTPLGVGAEPSLHAHAPGNVPGCAATWQTVQGAEAWWALRFTPRVARVDGGAAAGFLRLRRLWAAARRCWPSCKPVRLRWKPALRPNLHQWPGWRLIAPRAATAAPFAQGVTCVPGPGAAGGCSRQGCAHPARAARFAPAHLTALRPCIGHWRAWAATPGASCALPRMG